MAVPHIRCSQKFRRGSDSLHQLQFVVVVFQTHCLLVPTGLTCDIVLSTDEKKQENESSARNGLGHKMLRTHRSTGSKTLEQVELDDRIAARECFQENLANCFPPRLTSGSTFFTFPVCVLALSLAELDGRPCLLLELRALSVVAHMCTRRKVIQPNV